MRLFGKVSIKQGLYKGEKRWTVRFSTPDGKYHRHQFNTRAEALSKKQRLQAERESPLSNFPIEDQLDASAALVAAKQNGFTLSQAVDAYIKNKRGITESTLADAIKEFIDSREAKGLRPRSISSYRASLNSFAFNQGSQSVSGISPEDLLDFISEQEWGRPRVRRFLVEMGTFFGYCVKQGYCKTPPTNEVERPRVELAEVSPLSVHDCRSILKSVYNLAPELLAHITIGMFGGVRTNEILRLTWSDINSSEDFIDLRTTVSKTRQRRLVKISPILKLWLQVASDKGSPLPVTSFYKKWRGPKELSGIKNMTGNMLRKTCVSNHIAYHQNLPLAIDQFGHSEKVLYNYYRGVITPNNAKAFWEDLTPDKVLKG